MFKKNTFITVLFGILFTAVIALAVAPDVNQADKMILGRGDRVTDKIIEMNIGQSPTNPEINVDRTLQDMSLNNISGGFNVDANEQKLGRGADVDIDLTINNGDANEPFMRYDAAQSKWLKSDDGIVVKSLGGAGGGGGGINLLLEENFDFEDGDSKWTASGSSVFSITEVVGEIGNGTRSGKWDASAASENLDSQLVLVPNILTNQSCLLELPYRWPSGVDGDIIVKVIDQGSVVLQQVDLVQASDWQTVLLGFTCPSSGSVRLQLTSTADAAEVFTDDVHLGSNILLAELGIAENYGSAVWPETVSCVWSITQTSYAADFPADSDCPVPTVTGKVSAPPTKVPHILMSDAPAGIYFVTFVGQHGSGGESSCRLVDDSGTELSRQYQFNTGDAAAMNISGIVEYGSTANRTIKVQCRSSSGSADIENNRPDGNQQFFVQRFPTQGQTSLVGVDSTGQHWSGYHDGDCSWTTTSTSFADPGDDASCTFTERTNGNFGTVVTYGAAKPGIVFTPGHIGKYWACANVGRLKNSGASDSNIRLTDGTSVLSSSVRSSASTDLGGGSLCGLLPVDSLSPVSLRVEMGVLAASTATISGTGMTGGVAVDWTIFDITDELPMPFLVKQLQSTSSAVMRHATAHFTNSGVPATAREDGAWLDGVPTDNGTGDVTVNILAATFSVIPNCFCQVHAETGDATAVTCEVDKTTAPSTIAYRFRTKVAGTLTDRDFSVSCTGPR